MLFTKSIFSNEIIQIDSAVLYAQPLQKNVSGEKIFYYYNGQKVFFNLSYERVVIGIAEGHSFNEVKTSFFSKSQIPSDSVKPRIFFTNQDCLNMRNLILKCMT